MADRHLLWLSTSSEKSQVEDGGPIDGLGGIRLFLCMFSLACAAIVQIHHPSEFYPEAIQGYVQSSLVQSSLVQVQSSQVQVRSSPVHVQSRSNPVQSSPGPVQVQSGPVQAQSGLGPAQSSPGPVRSRSSPGPVQVQSSPVQVQ